MKPTLVDRDFLLGYLLAARDDECIELEKGWETKSFLWLSSKAKEAEKNMERKMLNGEILPSERLEKGK